MAPTAPRLDAAAVQQLVPQGQLEMPLTDNTPVLCIHRGRRNRLLDGTDEIHPQAARHKDGSREHYFVGDLKDTYDGRHYVIAPGYFSAEYGAALHFQRRAVVPGSRNPESGFQASFIAIIGLVEPTHDGGFRVVRPVDPQEDWPPFTDGECQDYSVAGDALNRAEMVNPIERDVKTISVAERLTGMPQAPEGRLSRGGGGARNRRGPQIEASDPNALAPVAAADNASLRQIAADSAERASGKDA